MQLRISTDSSSTTNWISHPSGLSLFLFLRMNRVSTSPCPVSSQIPPSNLLEIEEALNSCLSIYRMTTWIQNGTKQFLEIGIWGNYFLFGFIVSVNRCKVYSENSLLSITTSLLWPDSIGDQRVTKERDRDWRLETDYWSLGKTGFLQALPSILEKRSYYGEPTHSPGGKASFFSWNCTEFNQSFE